FFQNGAADREIPSVNEQAIHLPLPIFLGKQNTDRRGTSRRAERALSERYPVDRDHLELIARFGTNAPSPP
ncbi:MAG: hypothetical protein ACYC6Y_28105, partial [Thermoguttaceae bacterium]